MTVKIIREAALKVLRSKVEEHLPLYRSGNFDYLDKDQSLWHELPLAADEAALAEVKVPVGSDLFEVENCAAVYKFLSGIRPYDARDERLWVHLAHTKFLEYARARWPIPDDDEKAATHVRRHFFAQANRQIERDNAVSRLWWMAHLCSRVPEVSLPEALSAFLYKSDVRANIIERPTVAQSVNVFTVLLRRLVASRAGEQALFERMPFRKLMMEINSVGGFKLLDCLPQKELDGILDEIIIAKLGIKSV